MNKRIKVNGKLYEAVNSYGVDDRGYGYDPDQLTEKEWKKFDDLVFKFTRAYRTISEFSRAAQKATFLKGHKDRHNVDLYKELNSLFDFFEWDGVNDVFINYNEDNRGTSLIDIMDKAIDSVD